MVVQSTIQQSFPTSHLIPKEDIGALSFLADYPEYDGRGVVVCVLDTGVDPGAAHMQVTTDGKPKIVDIIDATGSGDICTKTVRRVGEDGTLELLTGRRITVPAGWSCPSGEYHVGQRRLYELFPEGLVTRLQEEKRKVWNQNHRETMAGLEQALSAWDEKNGPNTKSFTAQQKKERQDLLDRKDQLAAIDKSYSDPGPMTDAVVFYDGERHQACLLLEGQDPSTARVMTDYKVAQQYATFGEADMCNYTFNIYENGNVLSVHVPSGAHGTHVCGILAAHNPSNAEMNGIAPGAQIVSIKIGDTRLGSMETGQALVRALVATAAHKCDIINMSYGEDVQVPDVGHFTDLANEIVNKHGVVYVASAGNSGPALSSVTAPGGTTTALISVGAYVTEPLMDVAYTMREPVGANSYTWSSRGPATNGNYGVTICAPGGAITSVPNYTLKGSQLMNGTSMASPNACGGIALVLSGLKARGLPYTPHRVRRGLESTALKLSHVSRFCQGHGMLQVHKAFEHIVQHSQYSRLDVDFAVRVPTLGAGAKGIYLREKYEVSRPQEIMVKVDPVFHELAPNDLRIEFEAHIRLRCSAKWVQIPQHMVLMHDGREFGVLVDPTHRALAPGAHFTEISGHDANSPAAGPLFNIPVCVIVPESPQHEDSTASPGLNYVFKDMAYGPAHVERKFLDVPMGATWAELTLTASNMPSGDRKIVVHAQQLVPQKGHAKSEFHRTVTLEENAPVVRAFNVTGGRTLELCLAQFWSSLGTCTLTAEIHFHGLVPEVDTIQLRGDGRVHRVDVTSHLRTDLLAPSVVLNRVYSHYRPASAQIAPLPRHYDVIPDKRQVYELVLEYNFTQPETGDVTPLFPTLNGLLYESVFQGQICVVVDANKRPVYWGQMFAKRVKLEKGDYTLRAQLTSDKASLLEKQKTLTLALARTIPEIKLDAYATYNAAVAGGPAFGEKRVRKGVACPVFFAPPPADKAPTWVKAGDELVGTVTMAMLSETSNGSGKPKGFPFIVHVGPAVQKDKDKQGSEAAAKPAGAEASEWDKLQESLRDQKLSWLPKLYKDGASTNQARHVYDEVRAVYPDHLPVYSAWLKAVDSVADTATVPLFAADCRDNEALAAIVAAADDVVGKINLDALAAHFGVKQDDDDPAAAPKRAEMKKQKDALVEALVRKGRAVVERNMTAGRSLAEDPDWAPVLVLLHQWADASNAGYQLLLAHDHMAHGRAGSAAKIVSKLISNTDCPAAFRKSLHKWYADHLLGERLGWTHCQAFEQLQCLKLYPSSLPLF